MRHCPNCDGEVIVWDDDLQADKCLDCGESWTIDEQEQAAEDWVTYKDKYPRHPDDI